ncbi:MAG TPA: NADP-dependent isocitrate dehydrogenase, partial [Solirubrobacteraceae bacterium]|nr:NADP-dependent isocitrate dehydrogenase [Solirubrobacteraceae bacterium]
MKIVYTHTDEAPALATESLLPIIEAFAGAAGVELELRDISLSGRILAQFPERLGDGQRLTDALSELGELANTPDANIIKLPNISASVPQLRAAIEELQGQGYDVPDYPAEPADDAQREIRARYDKVKGSAVNPVLRQGNSDRRAPASVKEYARKHPHSMGEWSTESKSHVSTMSDGDFRSTEQSVTVASEGEVRIEFAPGDGGGVTELRDPVPVLRGEVIDASVMRRSALLTFLAEQIADARRLGVLFSVHLKATMMKVSDPIIFGNVVRAFFPGLEAPGWNPNDGLAALPTGTEIPYPPDGPALAMVDSDRGITNLHVPS